MGSKTGNEGLIRELRSLRRGRGMVAGKTDACALLKQHLEVDGNELHRRIVTTLKGMGDHREVRALRNAYGLDMRDPKNLTERRSRFGVDNGKRSPETVETWENKAIGELLQRLLDPVETPAYSDPFMAITDNYAYRTFLLLDYDGALRWLHRTIHWPINAEDGQERQERTIAVLDFSDSPIRLNGVYIDKWSPPSIAYYCGSYDIAITAPIEADFWKRPPEVLRGSSYLDALRQRGKPRDKTITQGPTRREDKAGGYYEWLGALYRPQDGEWLGLVLDPQTVRS